MFKEQQIPDPWTEITTGPLVVIQEFLDLFQIKKATLPRLGR